jgi:hypothetical protein
MPPSRFPGRLASLKKPSLGQPLDRLGLSTRAFRCLRKYETVEALLRAREDELMARRSFGKACLTDVRRQLTHFALDGLAVPDADPMRLACGRDWPERGEARTAPAQPRTLAEVVSEVLELLARGEQLRSRDRRKREPREPVLEGAGLTQLSEFVFSPLRPREREVLLLRYSAPEEHAPSLAELGRRFSLTRERIRQLTVSALGRLAKDTERQRRRPVTEWLSGVFREAGGVLREPGVESALRRRFKGAPDHAYPLTRALLETTSCFARVRSDVWCNGERPRDEVLGLLDTLYLVLRDAQRPMTARQLVARAPGRDEQLVRACLGADDRLREVPGARYGLREWEWGVPETLADCLAACIRTRARPQSIVRVVEHANAVLPPDRRVTQADVLDILATESRFVRIRTGVYGLAEWPR